MTSNMNSAYLLLTVILSKYYHASENSFSSAIPSPIQPSCEDVFLVCTNQLQDTLSEEGFSLLDEETLSAHCSGIIEDIECKKNYLDTCNPEESETFSLATDGVVDVLKELCNDTSNLRKVYRTHSPCIANISHAYENCILNAAETVSEYDSNMKEPDIYEDDEDDIQSSDSMIQRMCRFYNPIKSCFTSETQNFCGDSAAQLVEDMIIRMASAAFRAKCLNRTE